jgi:hypothetical protein
MKQLGTLALGKAAAFILDFHQNAITRRGDLERDRRTFACELERILEQVVERGCKMLRISKNLRVLLRGDNS